MIKVKTFVIKNTDNPLHHERLDAAINKFLVENDIEEVIDIKYSTAMAQTSPGLYAWKPSAMLIYKEKEKTGK